MSNEPKLQFVKETTWGEQPTDGPVVKSTNTEAPAIVAEPRVYLELRHKDDICVEVFITRSILRRAIKGSNYEYLLNLLGLGFKDEDDW